MKKILINSSFFETIIKTLNKHSNLISHMILRFKYSIFLSLILCVAVYLLGTHVFEHKYTAQLKYVPSSNDRNGGSSLLTIAQKLGLPNQNNNIDPGYDLLSWTMIPVYLKVK